VEDFTFLYPGQNYRDVAARWLAGGTELDDVTRGGDGAWASTKGISVDLPAPTTRVVDTVGAGDAFMSGLLDALRRAGLLELPRVPDLPDLSEQELTALVRSAATVASLTCEREGANPPSRAEVEAALAAAG